MKKATLKHISVDSRGPKIEPNSPPISIVVPSTISEKMEAIVSLSHAVEQLSRALESVNVNATVSHCYINTNGGKHPAINIS